MQTSLSIVVNQPGIASCSVRGLYCAHDDVFGFGVRRAEISDRAGRRRSGMTGLLGSLAQYTRVPDYQKPPACFAFLLVLHVRVAIASAGAAQCQADLSSIAQFIKVNDAGADTHLASRGAEIGAALAQVHAAAGLTPDVAACDLICSAM